MTRPLRVLFITRKYPPRIGGMEQLSYHLTQKIPCEKTIIAWRHSQIWLPFFTIAVMLYALFSARRYDMIHIGDPVLSIIAWVMKRVYPRKKIATTVHGLELTYPNPLYQRYIRWCIRSFDLYICISSSTERLAKKWGLEPRVVIPVGVDIEDWSRTYERRELSDFLGMPTSERFVCITTGRLVQRKGVLWFVKTVMPKLPESVIYLVLGKGPMAPSIQREIHKRNLGDRVKLLGGVSRERLRMIYRTADLFVMPNILVPGDAEGFGIVAIEAGASGLPVLASNIEGIRDAVKEGKSGWLVEAGDAGAFRQRIADFAANPSSLVVIRTEAEIFVREHYNWSIIVERYLDAFNRLIPSTTSH
ncbi:MAG: glycosyltransferase family 4 protein [Candidatus Kerfeldbacteria bacterium]|nr:glycosyltransferase family 4 protein [Candidatus Kerfeldbacteria bacterium]